MNGRQEFTYNKTAKTIDRFRAYKLKISGKAIGENGTEIVTEFVRKIPVGSHFSSVVGRDSVHLENLQRENVDDGEPDSHKFMMNLNLEPLSE